MFKNLTNKKNTPWEKPPTKLGEFPGWKTVSARRFASVDNISFTDYDLDFGDLGGLVRWDKPLDESKAPVKKTHHPRMAGRWINGLFLGGSWIEAYFKHGWCLVMRKACSRDDSLPEWDFTRRRLASRWRMAKVCYFGSWNTLRGTGDVFLFFPFKKDVVLAYQAPSATHQHQDHDPTSLATTSTNLLMRRSRFFFSFS